MNDYSSEHKEKYTSFEAYVYGEYGISGSCLNALDDDLYEEYRTEYEDYKKFYRGQLKDSIETELIEC